MNVKALRANVRRYLFHVLTAVVLVITWSWTYRPTAHEIALERAKIVAHETAIAQYDEAIKGRAEYERIKTETMQDLARTNVEPTLARAEAAFLREVGAIAKTNGVEWRAIRPPASGAVAPAPVATAAAAASGGSGTSALQSFATASPTAATASLQGIVETKPMEVIFRGRNAGVFKAIRALGEGKVLTHATRAGFTVENTPDGPQVSATIDLDIERVTADERMLFPPTPVGTPAALNAAPQPTATPFVPPTPMGAANGRA